MYPMNSDALAMFSAYGTVTSPSMQLVLWLPKPVVSKVDSATKFSTKVEVIQNMSSCLTKNSRG